MTPFVPHLQSYTLTEKLGESSWSKVYKGFHKRSPDDLVVLKFLFKSEAKSRHLRQKVERLKVLHDPRALTPQALIADGDALVVV